MPVKIFGFLGALLALCLFSANAQADPQGKAEALRTSVDTLAEGLDEESKRHFLTIYSNYNLIQTVEIVRGDVGKAVKACGENNPEIKEKIAAKFEGWQAEVNPVLDEAKSHLENMVAVQEYLKAQQIEDLFEQIDETRKAVQNQVQKTPVTSLAACNTMHDKMSETQDTMVKLLRSTLISFPQGLTLPPKEKAQDPDDSDDPMPEADTPEEL